MWARPIFMVITTGHYSLWRVHNSSSPYLFRHLINWWGQMWFLHSIFDYIWSLLIKLISRHSVSVSVFCKFLHWSHYFERRISKWVSSRMIIIEHVTDWLSFSRLSSKVYGHQIRGLMSSNSISQKFLMVLILTQNSLCREFRSTALF